MTTPYPPGWPEEYKFEGLAKSVVEALLKTGGGTVDSVRQIATDVVTGEALDETQEAPDPSELARFFL
ncbi:hypothetical protein ACFWOL_25720 [Streptomyces sp. NPDC058442]|uniref:hypothetical protein n=1 Tax=Streptomyces sp. NPDC058442 TaxID=3346503 RepID=UPI00366653A8